MKILIVIGLWLVAALILGLVISKIFERCSHGDTKEQGCPNTAYHQNVQDGIEPDGMCAACQMDDAKYAKKLGLDRWR